MRAESRRHVLRITLGGALLILAVVVAPAPEPAEVADDPVEPAKPAPAPAPMPVAKAKPVEPVIPLVHVPDDPGPDAVLDGEAPPAATPASGEAWQRFRKLFQ